MYDEAMEPFTEDVTRFYGASTIKFDFPNMSVKLQTDVPFIITNHNVMYGITARGEASIFYPVYKNQKHTVRHTPGADGAWATQAIHGGFLLGHGDHSGPESEELRVPAIPDQYPCGCGLGLLNYLL